MLKFAGHKSTKTVINHAMKPRITMYKGFWVAYDPATFTGPDQSRHPNMIAARLFVMRRNYNASIQRQNQEMVR